VKWWTNEAEQERVNLNIVVAQMRSDIVVLKAKVNRLESMLEDDGK
jgi:hypothetical protein